MPKPLSPPSSTAALVVAGAGGDRRALEELIGLYQTRVARFVIAQIRDETQCEDICQTIFVKMVLSLPKLREPERFEPWLYQIARNACRDYRRARAGWKRLFVVYESTHESTEATAALPAAAADEEAIARGMKRLSEVQRNLLKLSLEGQKSYEELARLSGTSVSAVKSRLHRARENLKVFLLAGDTE